MNIMNRIKQFFLDDALGFRERMLRIGMTFGSVVLVFGILEELIIKASAMTIIASLILLIVLIFCIFLSCMGRAEAAALIAGIVMNAIVFPVIFFLSGGIRGGATVWFVLGIFYLFLMYSGKKLLALLAGLIVEYSIVYHVAYCHPEFVHALPSRLGEYTDSLFAVLVVGSAVGMLLKYQIHQYGKEQRLVEQQKEELERLSFSRSQFFANVSHEIRTPINTIIGLNEVILREETSGEVAENAANIQNASHMLLSIVNDILDMSQMENHKMEIVPMSYNTKSMFAELVDMIQVRMKEKGLDFIVHVDSDLPSTLYGDKKRIQQVILNLLTNAVKYTPSGSVVFSVKGDMLGEEWIRLTFVVSDTGMGIQKGDLEYLFDSFSRINEKENHKIEGTGLGLAICKQLVNLMGGQITVDSIYTKGSNFTVILEQQIINHEPIGEVNFFAANHDSLHHYYRQSFDAPEAKVLIVDDSDMNRLVTEKLLRPTKVQIDTAQSGEECLALTNKTHYQVILMDHMMPGMDGVETLAAIRTQENGLCRDTPVIALTANSAPGVRDTYLKYGFQGYLEKPIQSDRLEEEVLRCIPEVLVEYRIQGAGTKGVSALANHFTGSHIHKKRRNICVTTDCVCDMSYELLNQLDVRVMYLYITTENGRFRDTREIKSDNLTQHLSQVKSTAYADSATIEEFEDFYAQTLAESEEVIHISMASNAGRTYHIAKQAARSFGHVHVIDSGHISCGEAIVVLRAAQLVEEEKSVDEICEELNRLVRRVRTSFFLPTLNIFYQRGYTTRLVNQICSRFNLHPILHMSQSRLSIVGLLPGNFEHVWKYYIRWMLRNPSKIDPSIVYVTHAGLSVRQLKIIEDEIKKHVDFRSIRIENASVSTSCNAGLGTFGISFLRK